MKGRYRELIHDEQDTLLQMVEKGTVKWRPRFGYLCAVFPEGINEEVNNYRFTAVLGVDHMRLLIHVSENAPPWRCRLSLAGPVGTSIREAILLGGLEERE